MQIFPTSNFDQSAITAVFLGTVVSWLLTETLGWVFAGLVVSGYLATLLVLEPRSAAIDMGEAVLTYAIARLLGEYLARTGLTSRVFGRERFLLIVLVSILVRIGVEGAFFPYVLPRASWAYSIGLVVVPLAANAFWKTGLWRGAIRMSVPTAVVYVLIREVMLPHTNLSLAWFQLANEDIAASFLASPKAYLLLLTGAVLAAAANVRYGWDYNGILLPALLALVIDSPRVLAATLIEIVVLLCVIQALLRWTAVGRCNIEGPRRLMLFFTVAYGLRFAAAALMGPDLFKTGFIAASGFGYLLPTLLAVKISQKGFAPVVLLPTAVVSIAAFGLGSAIGFAAERIDGSSEARAGAPAPEVARAPLAVPHAALWLSALARAEGVDATPAQARPVAWLGEVAEALVHSPGEEARVPSSVTREQLDGGVWLLRERFEDESRNAGTPSVLIAPKPARTRLVALIEQPLTAPETAAIGGQLLQTGVVDAVVIAGAEPAVHGVPNAGESARATARFLADDASGVFVAQGLVIALRRGATDVVHFAASERARTEARIAGLAAALRFDVRELAATRSEVDDVVIEVPPGYTGTWLDGAGEPAPPPSLMSASARAMALGALPDATRQPPLEDRLALRQLVLSPLLAATTPTSALPLIRQAAWALGYELLGPVPTADGDQAVVLHPRAATAAVALIARLEKRSGVMVEVPCGTRDALRGLAVHLGDRLDADIVLVGLDPARGPLGNAVFAEAHTAALASMLEQERRVVVMRGAPLDASSAPAAELARWGGDAADTLADHCKGALAQLGVETRAGTLDAVTREHAGRTVFGRTPLVAVTVDASLLERPLLARAEPVLEDFAGFVVVDAECSELAAALARRLPARQSPAPSQLLEVARRAAVERSVVARRSLEQTLATTRSNAAIARASSGVFLVVVGAHERGLVAAAHPLALAPGAEAAPTLRASTLAGCSSALDHGGTCMIERTQ